MFRISVNAAYGSFPYQVDGIADVFPFYRRRPVSDGPIEMGVIGTN